MDRTLILGRVFRFTTTLTMLRVICKCPGRRRFQRGVTLVELVTVLSVIAIFAMIAGGAWTNFIIQQRIRNAAYELTADLVFSRSEAVKRNADVTMSKFGTWAGGWTIVDAGGNTIKRHPAIADSVTITAAVDSVSFFLNGRASGGSFEIDDAGGNAAIHSRCISLDTSGRPRAADGDCP